MKSINFVFISGVLIFLLLVADSASSAGGIGTVAHGGNCEYVDPAGRTDTANKGKMCKDVGGLECQRTPEAAVGVGTPVGVTEDKTDDPVNDVNTQGICVCQESGQTWRGDKCKSVPLQHGSSCGLDDTPCMAKFKCGAAGSNPGVTFGDEDKFVVEWNAATHSGPGKWGYCAIVCVLPATRGFTMRILNSVRHSNPTKTIDVIHGGDCTDVTICKTIFECSIGGTAKTDGTTADAFGEKWDVAKHSGTYGKCMCKNAVFKTDKCEAAKDKTDGKDKDKDKSKSSGSDRILYPSSCMFLQLAIAAIGSLLLLGMS